MRFHLKIGAELLQTVRVDLARPHPFAAERIGFIRAGLAAADGEVLVLGAGYRPVADEHYRDDPSAPTSIGADAIREALEWTDGWRGGVFHVHAHGGRGIPGFSGIDIKNNARLVPSFFNLSPKKVHGALLLSDDCITGSVWPRKKGGPVAIARSTIVGAPMRSWWFR